MLKVLTSEEVYILLTERIKKTGETETVGLDEADFRVLAEDIYGTEYVPGFDRSTVDGYAVMARDTFGSSESIPAILVKRRDILMGEDAGEKLTAGICAGIPTGGAVPEGADAVVMIEYTEDYGDGTVGIMKPAAPGDNMIYKGDDVCPGKTILPKGRRLGAREVGALAAMGITEVPVVKRPRVGIISTGDELVPAHDTPDEGQIRDVNTHLLMAFCAENGAQAFSYGIIKDDEDLIGEALDKAVAENDLVLISGGSSVGLKDATCKLIEARGELLMHGISIKPGKPTIMGIVSDKPVVGLPGHPGAAYFISRLFISKMLDIMQGIIPERNSTIRAKLTENLGANHGRTQCTGVVLTEKNGEVFAEPLRSKSGLITGLAASDGFVVIPRDSEGMLAGDIAEVISYRR